MLRKLSVRQVCRFSVRDFCSVVQNSHHQLQPDEYANVGEDCENAETSKEHHIFSSSSKSKVGEIEMQNLAPELLDLLTGSEAVVPPGERLSKCSNSVWDRISSYKSNYIEKAVLLDPQTAEQIGQSILTHTRADRSKTVFFDGEGGLCQIGAFIQKQNIFKSVSILEKDMQISPLHEYAWRKYLDPETKVHPVNLCQSVPRHQQSSSFEPPLIPLLPSNESGCGDVSEDVPSYSLVSTVSHGYLKYLTSKLIYREDPFSEFYSCRPEFFFITPIRTYFHVCLSGHDPDPVRFKITEEEMRFKIRELPKRALFNQYNNVLFQSFFDFCLVDMIPRNSYYPWKKHTYSPFARPEKIKGEKMSERVIKANKDSLMVMYVRPKKPEDLQIANPKHFSHYLFVLFQNKNKFLICQLEEWAGGWGLVAIDMGYTLYTMVRDLSSEEMMTLYQNISKLPNFENSNLVIEANLMRQHKTYDDDDDSEDLEIYRQEFWKRFNSMETL